MPARPALSPDVPLLKRQPQFPALIRFLPNLTMTLVIRAGVEIKPWFDGGTDRLSNRTG
jgi:hypothetical protein